VIFVIFLQSSIRYKKKKRFLIWDCKQELCKQHFLLPGNSFGRGISIMDRKWRNRSHVIKQELKGNLSSCAIHNPMNSIFIVDIAFRLKFRTNLWQEIKQSLSKNSSQCLSGYYFREIYAWFKRRHNHNRNHNEVIRNRKVFIPYDYDNEIKRVNRDLL